jgi:hypothetical protein
MSTHLTLRVCTLIVAVRSGTQRSAQSTFTSANSSSLREVLLAFLLSDLDLLLFAAATQLVRLERALGLEVVPAMLRNIAFRHDRCRPLRLYVGITRMVGCGW